MKYLLGILTKSQKRKFFTLTLLMIFTAGMEILTLSLIFNLINVFSNNEIISNKLLEHLNNLIPSTNQTTSLLWLLLIIFFLKSISFIYFSWKQSEFLSNLRAELSSFYFKGYLNLPRLFHLRTNISDTVKNITYETECLVASASALSMLAMESTVLAGIALYLLILDLKVMVIASSILLICSYFIYYLNAKSVKIKGKERPLTIQNRLKSIVEGLTGSKISNLSGVKENFINNFNKFNYKLAGIVKIIYFRNLLPRPIFELFVVAITLIFLIPIFNKNQNILEALPLIGTFLAAGYRLVPSLSKILSQVQAFQYNIQSGVRLLRDKERFENFEKNKQTVQFDNFKKEIEIKDVSFSYEKDLHNEKNLIFKNLNFKIKLGKKVGIYSKSGAGKSTFLDLIMGFLTPSYGEILVDGVNVKLVSESWQKFIGCVNQETFILDESLKKNVAFGLNDDEIDNLKIEEALSKANLIDFKNNLKFGINSILGENGLRVSGGQRQRIGIARAMYNDPNILIFDEATNALDIVNEKQIIEEIFSKTKNKTIILVSHNKENFKFCDHVYKIENKNLVEV